MKKHSQLLLNMLLISTVLTAAVGAFLKFQVLRDLGIEREENILALPFVMLTDHSLQYQIERNLDTVMNPTEPPAEPTQITLPEPAQTETVPPTQPPTQPPAEPVSGTVEESWFDDALFIGDSRFVGLRDYARLGEAEYFAGIGTSIFGILDEWAKDAWKFDYTKLPKLLQDHNYGKIIIGLGINDAGADLELILERYQQLLDLIFEYQPDTRVIVHSVITVSRAKASSAWYFGLERIYAVNDALATLADGERVFYLDPNPDYADEDGYLPDEMAGDGCHFYVEEYRNWAQWIRDHVGYFEIP